MSGGELTDYQYDTTRLIDWANAIRADYDKDDIKGAKPELEWLADLLVDLEHCLFEVDRHLSGDSGPERSINAVRALRGKWFTGKGPSEADLLMMEVYARNILNRAWKIRAGKGEDQEIYKEE